MCCCRVSGLHHALTLHAVGRRGVQEEEQKALRDEVKGISNMVVNAGDDEQSGQQSTPLLLSRCALTVICGVQSRRM